MNSRLTDPERWVEASYRSGSDPAFDEIVQDAGPLGPDELADIIDADASVRLRSGRAVALRRYLSAVPHLSDWPVALDAAIEACFRAAAERGEADPASVLIHQHPELEPQIRRSEVLGQLFVQTGGERARPPSRVLPCELGPAQRDGRCRYELRELLGFGVQGSVYLAVDRQLSEPEHPAWVAVKILTGRTIEPGDDEAWRSEAVYLRRVMHANVVRVLERGVSSLHEPFIVYEYIQGRDLRARTESSSGRPAPRDSACLVRDLARGVQAVHSAGLVHCDLKPDNIILTDNGVPKIADFGVASPRQQPSPGPASERRGSPAFMAPEQFREEAGWRVPSADIYSLGAVLYWLLCGELPNGSCLAEIERNLLRNGRTAAPSPRAVNGGVAQDLDAICRRAMAPEPGDRYLSAEMLAADLDAFLEHRPLPWRHYSGLSLLQKLCRRQPLVVGMSVGVSALALAVAAGALWVHEDSMKWELERRAVAVQTAEDKERERVRALASAIRALDNMSKHGVGTEWMPIMSALEALVGPVFMGDAADAGSMWAQRISLAQGVIRDAGAQGREQDLEPLVWESALCLWLVRAGRSEEALGVLEHNRAAWALRLEPGDRWLARLDLLRRCADADLALRAPRVNGSAGEPGTRALTALSESLDRETGFDEHDAVARLAHALVAKGRENGLIGAGDRAGTDTPNAADGR